MGGTVDPLLLMREPQHLFDRARRGRSGSRPRPFAILSDPGDALLGEPGTPAPHRVRLTPQRRAISSSATPSHAHNNPRACTTWRCGNDVEDAIRSSCAR